MNDTTINGFAHFGLAAPLVSALAKAKFVTPTPIQAAAIPPLLEGRDIIGIAQTGTGKTAAFALPILDLLAEEPARPAPRSARVIVMSPTRELAVQIAETFKTLSVNLRITIATMFGGVSERGQIIAAERGIDVLVATPGRLVDLVERRFLKLDRTEVFVLDEADRMLDMGFVREVKKLVRLLPKERQSMMFSATMPPPIREIAAEMLHDPAQVSVTPEVVTVEKIEQSVYHVAAKQKRQLLLELLKDEALRRVVVFCRTKHGANKVADFLDDFGLGVVAIHGNKSQNARQAALNAFKSGNARVLVATDIASRGIDVPGISHVINYELTNEPEAYVHRIGRTARAGKDGFAISFCDPAERAFLKQIERLTKVQLTPVTHDLPAAAPDSQRPSQPRKESARKDEPRRDRGHRPENRRDERPRFEKPRFDKPRGDAPRDAKPAQETRTARPEAEGERKPKTNRPGSRARARMRSAA